MLNFKKNLLQWLIWLLLVIVWNYGFPQATALQDVIVAVLLSLTFILINFFFYKR
jgi:hypothetical protein